MPRPTHDGCCLRRGASAAATSTSSLSFRHRKISTASTGRLNSFRFSSSSELRSTQGSTMPKARRETTIWPTA